MKREYWDLFWTTGMPEAWLMSRGGEIVPPAAELKGGAQGVPGPLASSPGPLIGNVPGSPRNLY